MANRHHGLLYRQHNVGNKYQCCYCRVTKDNSIYNESSAKRRTRLTIAFDYSGRRNETDEEKMLNEPNIPFDGSQSDSTSTSAPA